MAAFMLVGLASGAHARSRPPASPADLRLSFAPVARQAMPAVVSIFASRVVAGRAGPFAGDPFFSQFFEGLGATRPQVERALGSGVIVDGGYVVSNFHVVGNATDIRVILADRREFSGRVVLADKAADLAVMVLDGAEGEKLPTLKLGDSSALEVGDLTLAIGNPFGLGQTVSMGIISGLARTGGAGGGINPGRYYVQTDAPINPGNSGGALVNMQAEVIGINTLIVTSSGGSDGIGFAIPSNLVAQVVAQAAQGNDRFVRPWPGIDAQAIDAELARALGLDHPQGIIVRKLAPESPFAKAGVKPGDVILSLGGEPVDAPSELAFLMATHPLGARVPFVWLHDGRRHEGKVAMVPPPEAALRDQAATIQAPGPFAGLTVAPMSAALADELGLDPAVGGLVVLDTSRRTGRFLPGDVLISVNGVPLRRPQDLEQLVARGANWWRVEMIRAGRRVLLQFNR